MNEGLASAPTGTANSTSLLPDGNAYLDDPPAHASSEGQVGGYTNGSNTNYYLEAESGQIDYRPEHPLCLYDDCNGSTQEVSLTIDKNFNEEIRVACNDDLIEDDSELPSASSRVPGKSAKTVIKLASQAISTFGSLFKGSGPGAYQESSGSSPSVKAGDHESDKEEDAFGDDEEDGIIRQTARKNFLNSRLLSAREMITLRKRKSRRKLVSNTGNPLWMPLEEPCHWLAVGGREICLPPTNMMLLCGPERQALQQLALQKLHGLSLGCHVSLPKETPWVKGRWRRILEAGRKGSATGLQSIFDKESKHVHHVFGIPLAQVIANDACAKTTCVCPQVPKEQSTGDSQQAGGDKRYTRRGSAPNHESLSREPSSPTLHRSRKTKAESSSGQHSNSDKEFGIDDVTSNRRASRLFDALTLSSSSASSICILDRNFELQPQQPQIPVIVRKCIEFIEKYALHVLGIFRTGGSKKRVRQMKDEFDSGGEIVFDADANQQDVAALFKEFFRELPDPLLSRELYNAFLATRQIENPVTQLMALQYLVSLLPVPSRDTLNALLSCLSKVASCAADVTDADGNLISGNKMDSRNLATLIGPNILHKAKSTGQPYSVDEAVRAEENKRMVEVVKEMIDKSDKLFEVSAELHDEVLRLLLQTDPEAVDYVLRKKASRLSHGEVTVSMDNDIIPRQDKVKRAMTVGPLRSRLSDEGSYMRNAMWGRLSPTNLSSSQRRNTASGSNYGVRSDSMRSQRSTYSEPDGSNHRKTSELWSSSPGNRRSQSDSATPVTSEKFPGNDLGKNTILTKDGGLSVVGGFVRGWNRLSDRGFRRKVSVGESTHSSSLQSSRNVSQASTPHSSPATSPRLQHSPKTNITLDEKPRKERDLFQRLHSSKRKDSASATEEITVECVEVKNEQPVFLCDVLDAPSFIMPKASTGNGTHTSHKDLGSTQIRDEASNESKEERENLRPSFSGKEHILSASSSENLLKGWPIWDKIPGEALPEQETSL